MKFRVYNQSSSKNSTFKEMTQAGSCFSDLNTPLRHQRVQKRVSSRDCGSCLYSPPSLSKEEVVEEEGEEEVGVRGRGGEIEI